MSDYLRYRIGVINDFRNSYSFVDYQQWGDKVKVWDASRTSSAHRGYALPDDSISVFLNFKKLQEFKTTEGANQLVRKLLSEAPVSLTEFQDYVIYE